MSGVIANVEPGAEAEREGVKSEPLVDAVLAELRQLGVPQEDVGSQADVATVRRYLAARHNNPQKAARLLAGTLKWRKEFKTDTLRIGEFDGRSLSSGRMYIAGNDPAGKSILVTRKRSDAFQAGEYDSYLRYLVFTLQTGERAMQGGQDKWVWLMDMKGYSRANSPPLGVSMATLRILADHFPERLHRCFFIDAPSIFSFLFNALWPFIDPVTRQKIVFIQTKDFAGQIEAVQAAGEDEAKREEALAAAGNKEDADAFVNYLRWYCAPYDEAAYRALLASVGWSE
ncbi:hypothetical protein HYH03_003537 [Edaphochlamys debaryana]|uniref:CRAL-TRIO domain-containing protein n=1 Tax=Edaphochlamys debaryana TaxID=47281 RepID=A0A835YCG9_9CHLO|nr:hypothetical protein HYH03_003537 [Edaphochlamys debaryana]|eukprot:KAG2498276.1 hypothetical protein HYH03_003537 [Edaphochlamys debaryana]